MKRYDQAGRDVTDLPGLWSEEDRICEEPCHPQSGCEHCAEYWQRMVAEGMWDDVKGRWTDAGWSDILRHA